MVLAQSHRMVVKVGSSLLIDEEQQTVNMPWLVSLIDDLAAWAQLGSQLLVVTSGAIAYGKLLLRLPRKGLTLDQQQAAAAVGQIQLMHTYQTLLSQQRMMGAQILMTLEDSENRRRYINLSHTMESLLEMGVVPIINENDSVATTEIRYGDNDRLAARVAQMVRADTLVLLSDIDGFYNADPRQDQDAKLIEEVALVTPELEAMAQGSTSGYGTGGMVTKLAAAKMAMASGCQMVLAAGHHKHPLKYYEEGRRGTLFKAKTTPERAKQLWLRDHLQLRGRLVIDAGAVKALQGNKSLLPIGIVEVQGDFQKGDAVGIWSLSGEEIARGLSNYAAVELTKLQSRSTSEVESLLGYCGCHEVVHRDHLVII